MKLNLNFAFTLKKKGLVFYLPKSGFPNVDIEQLIRNKTGQGLKCAHMIMHKLDTYLNK